MDLTAQPLTKLSELIRSRAVSPVEVLEAHLRQIECLNPQLNAIVTLAPDALDRAREAEASIARGETAGLLQGVPVTVKDTIETRNLRATSGSRVRAEYFPPGDAPAVARLRRAGAIILGKTNTSEMALDYTADNPVFGRTNNPHDMKRTPGGSSGGCAAAVAACLTPAGLGSDLAGSIRIPAHFCGICGLKPTAGLVPGSGNYPPSTGPYSLGAARGPLARSVADLALLFEVLAVVDGVGLRPAPLNLRGWRVAWYTDDTVTPVTEETRRAVETAARALGEAGLVVDEQRPPGVERGPALWLALFSRATQRIVRSTYEGRENEAGPVARIILERAATAPKPLLDEYLAAWEERDRLRAALSEWMKSSPLIVAPVGAVPAFEHGTRKVTVKGKELGTFQAFGYSQTFNVFDLPAACVPAGRTSAGLPVGVQIVGRPCGEWEVLAAARIVEEALGGWQPAPLALSHDGHNPL